MTRIGGVDYRPAYERNPAGIDKKDRKIETPKDEKPLVAEVEAGGESSMGDKGQGDEKRGYSHKDDAEDYKSKLDVRV